MGLTSIAMQLSLPEGNLTTKLEPALSSAAISHFITFSISRIRSVFER
jgi:hypothetical protein